MWHDDTPRLMNTAPNVAERAATRWAARFLLWLQALLETQTVLG